MINNLKDKKINQKILIAIFVFAFIVIFFRLGRADMQTDGAHYSFRAVGYLDYLTSEAQTTPIQWFGEIPWWGKLSFHDHPPLIFFIQHIFFTFLGSNTIAARLPFALAGFGSVILLYFIGKQLYSQKHGYLAAFLLVISTFFVWSSRINFLEGMETFFILLAILFFLKALKKEKYFLYFGLFLGLALISKYSAFFLIPVFIFYILITNRKLFINRYFIFGLVIAVVIFFPVLLYNLMLYTTRGHFDAQISAIFPFTFEAAQKDWPVLYKEKRNLDYIQNFIGTWRGLETGYSKPFYWSFIAAVIFIVIKFLKNFQSNFKKNNIDIDTKFAVTNNDNQVNKPLIVQQFLKIGRLKFTDRGDLFLILIFVFITVFFIVIGPGIRYLPIFTPFIALALAVFIFDINTYLGKRYLEQKYIKYLPFIIFIPIAGFELFYNLNTNWSFQPIGQKNKQYSIIRAGNTGFNELERYLKEAITAEPDFTNKVKKISKLDDTKKSLIGLNNKNIYIYENSLKWFSTFWYFTRYRLYHNIYFISDVELFNIFGMDKNWFEIFAQNGAAGIYYIKGVGENIFDPNRDNKAIEFSEAIEKIFKDILNKDNAIGEFKEIKEPGGEVAFRVYYLKFQL